MSSTHPIRWTPERDQEAIRLRRTGKTFLEIGDLLHISHQNVFRRLHALGAAGNPKQPKPEPPSKRGRNPSGTQRPCLCCKKSFYSAGPHNRLCAGCRNKDISPFATF